MNMTIKMARIVALQSHLFMEQQVLLLVPVANHVLRGQIISMVILRNKSTRWMKFFCHPNHLENTVGRMSGQTASQLLEWGLCKGKRWNSFFTQRNQKIRFEANTTRQNERHQFAQKGQRAHQSWSWISWPPSLLQGSSSGNTDLELKGRVDERFHENIRETTKRKNIKSAHILIQADTLLKYASCSNHCDWSFPSVHSLMPSTKQSWSGLSDPKFRGNADERLKSLSKTQSNHQPTWQILQDWQ